MHVLMLPSWYCSDQMDIRGSFFRESALALKAAVDQVGLLFPHISVGYFLKNLLRGKCGSIFEDDCGVKTIRHFSFNWFPRMPSLRRFLFVWYGKRLFRQYVKRHGRPDLIIAHAIFDAGLLAAAINKAYDLPYVLAEHNSDFLCEKYSSAWLDRAKKVASGAKACFAVSAALRDSIQAQLGDEPVFDVLPNPVNDFFFQGKLRSVSRGEIFRFLTVCGLDEIKAVDLLIKSFARAFKDQENVELLIVGSGPCQAALMALAESLGIASQCKFLGRLTRKEVAETMLACDAFVLTSIFETFGVVVVEAFASGCPVISTRSGGPDGLISQHNGLLVDVGDAHQLAEAMRRMVEHQDMYDRESIRETCKARYSEQAYVARVLPALEQALVDE